MRKKRAEKSGETGKPVKESKALTLFKYILVSRYFIPILTTAGWIMIFSVRESDFFLKSSVLLIVTGIITAVMVSPSEYFGFIISSGVKFFSAVQRAVSVNIAAEICAGVFGFTLGFAFGLIVTAAFPAIFTINKFFNQ